MFWNLSNKKKKRGYPMYSSGYAATDSSSADDQPMDKTNLRTAQQQQQPCARCWYSP
jgi:hypothetical protein